jgi:hypothetical protein
MLDRFGVNLKYIGRPDSATPAVGSTKVHEKQAKALLMDVFPALATAMKARDDNKPAATAASESDKKSADCSKTTDRATADTSEPKSKRSGTGRRTTAQKR